MGGVCPALLLGSCWHHAANATTASSLASPPLTHFKAAEHRLLAQLLSWWPGDTRPEPFPRQSCVCHRPPVSDPPAQGEEELWQVTARCLTARAGRALIASLVLLEHGRVIIAG